jgi:hypothetical protein
MKLSVPDKIQIIKKSLALGLSYDRIGQLLGGVSRQRIEQLIKRHRIYVNYEDCSYLRIAVVASQLNVSKSVVRKFCRSIKLPTRKSGGSNNSNILVPVQSIPLLKDVIFNSTCAFCNQPMGRKTSIRQIYCSRPECQHERLRYVNWSTSRRTKHAWCVKQWQVEHPERYREISRKACRKYQAKKRLLTKAQKA